MLTQHNCFDNVLHMLLKQNVDITASKTANFCSILELHQIWSSCNKDLQSYRIVHKSKSDQKQSVNWS